MNDVFLIQPALVIATRQFRRKKEKKRVQGKDIGLLRPL